MEQNMRNARKGFYDRLDDTLMNYASSAVRAWNRVTGKSKSDLASASIATYSLGCLINNLAKQENITPLTIGEGVLGIAIGTLYQQMERREVECLESNVKSEFVEELKGVFRIVGSVGLWATTGALIDPNSTYLSALSLFAATASNYIIRTEHLPPKKEEKRLVLEEIVQNEEFSEEPDLVPIPIPN